VKRLVAVAAAAAIASAAAWTTVGGIDAARGQTPTTLIKRAHEGAFRPAPNRNIFILALGSDRGAPRYKRGGLVEAGLADSIHIIAINPARKAGTIVGIPRDTYMQIPGHGSNKINAAMVFGGPNLVVRALELLTGITFDYYMVTGFDGLEDMVNELGGIPVSIPYRIIDRFSGARLAKGSTVLFGRQALAFSRARHGTPNGDFSRSANQGLVFLGALAKARQEIASNPGRVLHYLRILLRHIKTDIPLDEALRLGLLATQIAPASVSNVVAPGTIGNAGGASVVLLTAAASSLFSDVAADALVGP
jgi:LCP family protein required for cell wall assembly